MKKLKKIKPVYFTLKDAVEEFKNCLEMVVERYTEKISHCAVFISGGVDSALLLSLLKERVKVKCFTAGVKNSSDVRYAKLIAHRFSVPHFIIDINENNIENIALETIKIINDYGAMQVCGAIIDYSLMKAAKEKGESIAFYGSGMDIIFGGLGEHFPVYNELKEPFHKNFWKLAFFIAEVEHKQGFSFSKVKKIGDHFKMNIFKPFDDFEVWKLARKIDARLNFDQKLGLWKIVPREAALELGVPKKIAFRPKLHPQKGSGIFDLFEKIAKEKIMEYCPDKGSNYLFGVDRVPPVVKYFLKSFALSRGLVKE